MILKREVIAGINFVGSGCVKLVSTPSFLSLICSPDCCGSTWISLALMSNALIKIRSTNVTMGEASLLNDSISSEEAEVL